jgi:asparagine synthase (glutamine-hydrolysing)
MMAHNSNRPVKTFSIGYKDESFSELKSARQVAEKYGCEHHEQILEPESISLLSKVVSMYDEPFADSSAIPTYHVSQLARQFVTVVLSGDGGDELFAGYNIYRRQEHIHKFPLNFNSAFLNKIIWGSIHKALPADFKGKDLSYYLSKNKKYTFAYFNLWTTGERDKLFIDKRPEWRNNNASENFKSKILKNGAVRNDYISNMQYLDLKTYLVDDILTKVDRASMMNSLEVRVPILDHKFAELTFRIPPNLKMNGSDQKYIFKKAMAQYLPEGHLCLPKKGFGIPRSLWFKKELKEYIQDTLLSATPLYSEYLNKKVVSSIIKRNRNPLHDFSSKIWTLLVFEEWLKQNNRS